MVKTGASGKIIRSLGAVAEDIVPDIHNTYNLGSSAKQWATLFVVLALVGSLVIGGTVKLTTTTLGLIINDSTNIQGDLDIDNNLTAINITANLYFGDGSKLTGISGGIWTNVSGVATFKEKGVNITGNLTVGEGIRNQILVSDNTESRPSYSFIDDIDTGMDLAGVGFIDFIISGSSKFTISLNNLNIKFSGSQSSPALNLRGDTNTGMWSAAGDMFNIGAGNIEFIRLHETGQDILVFNENGVDIDFRIESDDFPHMFFIDGDLNRIGINTSTSSYPLEIVGHQNNISLFVSHNISATGFITRTSVFDKSKNVWDFIKDASYYFTNGKIDHEKFYGYAGKTSVTDYSRPRNEFYIEEVFNNITEKNENVTLSRIIYPFREEVSGVSLNAEIDVLRQAVFELKQDNNLMRISLCNLGETQWC